MIHTVKGFGMVNKAEGEVFLELSWFFSDLMDVGNFYIVVVYIDKKAQFLPGKSPLFNKLLLDKRHNLNFKKFKKRE